ncbi:MAG: DUF134 domain-containing protein [Thermoplasmata archaeon]
MPRPRRFRQVNRLPDTDYFVPANMRNSSMNEIVISVEEYEAIRLKDLMQMDQTEAAALMGISQATFHRLLSEARKKVAEAIVNGKAIRIYGGTYKMKNNP